MNIMFVHQILFFNKLDNLILADGYFRSKSRGGLCILNTNFDFTNQDFIMTQYILTKN